MSFTALDWSILAPAWLAGLLILSTHVPLGQQVLARGIIFVDLAIAQLAGLGVIVADTLGWEAQGWQTQVAAVSTAMLGALLLSWSERRWPEIQEALIGVLFVLAATGAVVLISNDPHGGEHLKDLLVGQILWVIPSDLVPVAILYAVVLALWFGARERLGSLGFYLLFSVMVTASVQLVGVYLVFASLIIPALATRDVQGRAEAKGFTSVARGRSKKCSCIFDTSAIHGGRMPEAADAQGAAGSSRASLRLVLGYALGGAGYAAGLVLSAFFDLPAGAIIVWMLALLGVLLAVMYRFNFCSRPSHS